MKGIANKKSIPLRYQTFMVSSSGRLNAAADTFREGPLIIREGEENNKNYSEGKRWVMLNERRIYL